MKKADLELIRDYLDGRVTVDQLDGLNRLLEADAEARTEFRIMATLEEGLRDLSVSTDGQTAGFVGTDTVAGSSSRKLALRPIKIGLALVGIAMLGLLVAAALPLWRGWQWSRAPVIGEVTALSGMSLHVDGVGTELVPGDVLRAGRYRLDTGLVEFRTELGVEVLIEAPALLEIHAADQVELGAGRLSAHVPPEGIGFVVQTPSAEVVDFGTQFAVEVNEQQGTSEVHVFDGEVEVKGRRPEATPTRLHTGEAARVEAADQDPAGISLASDRFLLTLDEPDRTHTDLVREFGATAHYRMRPSEDGQVLSEGGGRYPGRIFAREKTRSSAAPGRIGSSLRLGGRKGASHAVVDRMPLEAGTDLTWSGLIRADSRPRSATIAQVDQTGRRMRLELHRDTGRLSLEIHGGDDGNGNRLLRLVDNEVLSLGEWHQVAFTFKEGEGVLYRDGIAVDRGMMGALQKSSAIRFSFGARLGIKGEASRRWDGRIDEVAVFSQALDSAQILQLFQSTQSSE